MSALDRFRLGPLDDGAVEAVVVMLLASAQGVEGQHIMRAAMRAGMLWQCVCKAINYPRAQCCECRRPRPGEAPVEASTEAPAAPAGPVLVCVGCGRTEGHPESCNLGGYVLREDFPTNWTEL